jgi:hypothetical protein
LTKNSTNIWSNTKSANDVKNYAEAVFKFAKLNTATQQCEAVVQGRSLLLTGHGITFKPYKENNDKSFNFYNSLQ